MADSLFQKVDTLATEQPKALVSVIAKMCHITTGYTIPDELVVKAKNEGFYGTMYGERFRPGTIIIHIESGEADIRRDGSLQFVWGYPGPDFNIYKVEDYGKTWALTKEELLGQGNCGTGDPSTTEGEGTDSSVIGPCGSTAPTGMTETEGG